MGNEQSKKKELTTNGKLSEKHENGSMKGLPANITSTDANGEAAAKQNGGPHPSTLAAEPAETGFVIVETDGQHVDAPVVICEIHEAAVQKEEVKKSKEEKSHPFGKMFRKKAERPAAVQRAEEKEATEEVQVDASPPAVEPQPESGPSEEETAAVVIAEHREDSTQTDRRKGADISTQTGDDDDDDDDYTAINTDDAVEVEPERAAAEDSRNGCAVVVAEDVIEEIEDEDDQTAAGIILDTTAYENMVFRAEWVEVIDNFEIINIQNSEEESVNKASAESSPDKCIVEQDTRAQRNDGTLTLEISSSLPKVVADCVMAVFAADSDSTDAAADEFPADNGEGVVALIEAPEPETNAVTPPAEEAINVPTSDEASKVMETILDVVCEESGPTPAEENMLVKELSAPVVVTEILDEMESAADDAAAVDDVPNVGDGSNVNSEPVTVEEAPEDTASSLDDEVKPESISEVVPAHEQVSGDDMGQETAKEDDTEVIPGSANDARSQELDITEELAVNYRIPLAEELITATRVVLFSKEANLTEPEETVAELLIEEATEALANEVEAVPVEDATEESDQFVSVSEELIEENIALADELLRGAERESAETFVTEANIAIPEEPSETVVEEEVIEEATLALSNEAEAVPVEDATEESDQFVSVNEELIEENIALADELLRGAERESAETFVTEANIAIPEEPSETVVEEVIEEVTEVLSNEAEAVPPEDGTEESEPCATVQEELGEENVALADELLEDADKETSATIVGALSGEANLVSPEESSETVVEEVIEEITKVLSNEVEAVPVGDATEESDQFVSVNEELIEENIALADELLRGAERESAETFVPEANIAIPEEPSETVAEEEVIEEVTEVLSNEAEAVPPEDGTEESEPCATVQEELGEENVALADELLEDADKETSATIVGALSGEANLVSPEESSETVAEEEVIEEVTEILSNEVEAVPVEDATEESDQFVSVNEELIEENIALADELLRGAERESAETFVTEANIAIPEEPSETVVEEVIEEVTEVLSNEAEAVPPEDGTEESEPCATVQEELVEENIAPTVELPEDADKESAAPSAEEEPTHSSLVSSEDAVEESPSLLKPPLLLVLIESTEEYREVITFDTEDAVENSVENSVETSVEVDLDTIVEELVAQDILVEYQLVPSDEAVIAEEETESSENSSDSTQSAERFEDTIVASSDLQTLLVRLESACASVVEESAYRLGDLNVSSLGFSITVTIHVAPEEEQQ